MLSGFTCKKNILFLSTLLIFVFCISPAFAAPAKFQLSTAETDILKLINKTRANPLADLESRNLGTKQLKAGHPDLIDEWQKGLCPLTGNGNFHLLADFAGDRGKTDAQLNSFLIERNYYPKTIDTAESTILLTNFISPSEAARTLYKNILSDELKQGATLQILDPEMTDVGIRLFSEKITVQDRVYNAYTLTLYFGQNTISQSEAFLFELINQARTRLPDLISQDAILDLTGNDKSSDIWSIYKSGLPPLAMDYLVFEAAQAHGLDMLENNFFSTQNLDYMTVDDRLQFQGYIADTSDELLGIFFSQSDIDLSNVVQLMFDAKLNTELNQTDSDALPKHIILNTDYTDCGLFLGQLQDTGTLTNISLNRQIMVIDTVRPMALTNPALVGSIWNDTNSNNIYEAGEGSANKQITIIGNGFSRTLFTNLAGGFTARLQPGTYDVFIFLEAAVYHTSIKIDQANVSLNFILPDTN